MMLRVWLHTILLSQAVKGNCLGKEPVVQCMPVNCLKKGKVLENKWVYHQLLHRDPKEVIRAESEGWNTFHMCHSKDISSPPDPSYLENRLKDTLKCSYLWNGLTRSEEIYPLPANISELQPQTFEAKVGFFHRSAFKMTFHLLYLKAASTQVWDSGATSMSQACEILMSVGPGCKCVLKWKCTHSYGLYSC